MSKEENEEILEVLEEEEIIKGYYWIRFRDKLTIGYYDYDGEEKYGEEIYSDGSGTRGDTYTWIIMGSDNGFKNKQIEVIRKVK